MATKSQIIRKAKAAGVKADYSVKIPGWIRQLQTAMRQTQPHQVVYRTLADMRSTTQDDTSLPKTQKVWIGHAINSLDGVSANDKSPGAKIRVAITALQKANELINPVGL